MVLPATNAVSKRRPYPYDLYLGEVRCLLEPGADGNMVSQKTKTLDATAPVDYTYSSANPYKERAFEWQELYGGFGQGMAPQGGRPPRRYSWAEKVDTSIDGLWMKGPKFENHDGPVSHLHQEVIGVAPVVPPTPRPPSPAGEVRQYIWAMHGGALTLFVICQHGVFRRVTDDDWVVSLSAATLGAGVFPQQAMRFKHRGAGTPIDSLYVATSASNLWRYDGAAWTMAAAGGGGAAAGPGTGAAPGEARFIERVQDELWVAGDYWVTRATDDPMIRANWSGVIYIGDQTAKITWLKQIGDSLIIFKEDGIYTIDTDGLPHELFPTLRGKNTMLNGKNAAVWIDRMWFAYGSQTFTMTADAQLRPDGMEQMLENTSDIHGQWVGGAGHNTWFFYEIYYNVANDTTYLVKHGTWIEENANQATPGVAQFAEAHHGALYDWDKQATCIEVVSGIPGSNDRLYVGFLDGTSQWCMLPKNTPNPAEDSACEFTALDSYVYLPTHHAGFRADNKLWHAITALGPRLNNVEWLEVEYRLDISNPSAEWTKVLPDEPKFTLPSQRLAFTEDEVQDPVSGKLIEFRVKLLKDPDFDKSPFHRTPITEGIVVHESIRPAFSREFTFNIKIGSFLPRHDGVADRKRGATLKAEILQRCAQTGPVNVLMPTGEYEALTIVDYKDSAVSRKNRRDHEWLVAIQGIQLGILSDASQIVSSGLTYETLEQYTLGELESII